MPETKLVNLNTIYYDFETNYITTENGFTKQ